MSSYTNLLNSFWQKVEDETFEGLLTTNQQKNDVATRVISILNGCGLMDICSKCDYLKYSFPKLASSSPSSDDDDRDYDEDSALTRDDDEEDDETEYDDETSTTTDYEPSDMSSYSSSTETETASSSSFSSSESSETETVSSASTKDPEFITYSDIFNLLTLKLKHSAHSFLFGGEYF